MKNWLQLTLATTTALVISGACESSFAGLVESAKFIGQPLIYQQNGKIDGCGLRVVGISDFETPKSNVRVIDGSFTVTDQGLVLLKAGMKMTTGEAVLKGDSKARIVFTDKFWMRASGKNPTTPHDGIFRKSPQDQGFLIYGTASYDTFDELIGVLDGETELQIGMRELKAGNERVLAGKVAMSTADVKRVAECLESLLRKK
jgi:uncharacterized Zn-binding protein involved in type VI secretion